MKVTRFTTERIPPGASGLVAAANIEGTDLLPRAAPLVVKFGDVRAESVTPLVVAAGVRAVFRTMPHAGARLAIGYLDEPLEDTPFEWIVPPPELVG
jgi:hypothetical protein